MPFFLQDLKNHFRMRIRMICERLIRKMGYEFVESLVPEEHKKLLVNIRCGFWGGKGGGLGVYGVPRSRLGCFGCSGCLLRSIEL